MQLHTASAVTGVSVYNFIFLVYYFIFFEQTAVKTVSRTDFMGSERKLQNKGMCLLEERSVCFCRREIPLLRGYQIPFHGGTPGPPQSNRNKLQRVASLCGVEQQPEGDTSLQNINR